LARVSLQSSTLAVTEPQIQGSTLTVCRNQACFNASFAGWHAAPSGAGSGIPPFPDPLQRDTLHTPLIEAVMSTETAGGFRLAVSYLAWSAAELQDGDIYDVTLTAGDGTKIVDSHQTMTYVISYPSGSKECGPECRTATGTL
jgi:hypothetical protein